MSAERQIRVLRSLVRPVVFETGSAEFPLSTAGTAFLLTSDSKTFFLTAKHVIGSYPPGRLRVHRTNDQTTLLRIKDFYRINAGEPGTELEDVMLFEVEPFARDPGITISIDPATDQWHTFKHTAQFFVIGYPEPKSYVDYEASVIHSGQVLLPGRYTAPATGAPYCHDLAVENPHALATFSGFSGGPVFSIHERIAMPSVLHFCGMALQGTPEAGVVRFLDCSIIQAALDEIHKPLHLRRAREA